MQRLQGTAERLKFATEVSGSDNSTQTDHVASFLLNGKPVRLSLPESILIDAGDTVSVAGTDKRGVFEALAYRNHSTGALGKGSVVKCAVLGGIFSVVGAATAVFGIGLIFLGIGVWLCLHARKLSAAFKLVEADPAPGATAAV